MVLSDRDRTLLTRCLERAEGAWEDFVERYLPLITHVVSSVAEKRVAGLADPIRDDLVADILLSLVEQDFAILRRFRGQSSFGTYLVVVSRRIAVRKLGKMRLASKTSQAVMVADRVADKTSAEPVSLEIDNAEEVDLLLARLPEQEATAIRMFHLEHRTYSDIGRHFGIPENSVGPLLSRARDQMRSLRK